MIKKTLQHYFVIPIIALLCTLNIAGQPKTIEGELTAMMKQLEVVGLSVVVVKNKKIIYTNAFGLKDIASNTPLKSDHLFRIASISKSFSATAIMQLIEKGMLSLTDDFGTLVGFPIRNPNYPDIPITLGMVMSHTSGINDSQGYFNLDVINPAKNPDWAKCYSAYQPGTGYKYCNLNYNMVGTVIEKLSGVRFDQHIKRAVLDPLKLYGGYCIDSLDSSRFVTLYEYDSAKFTPSPQAYAPRREEIRNYVMGQSTPIFSPTGGMKISAPDLAKYMLMHMNHGRYKRVRLMSKKSSKIMQTQVAKEEGYALALMNLTNLVPGKKMIGHTGSAYGLYSAMFFEPAEKIGFVVITNGCNPSYTDGINTVLKTTINILYKNFTQ